MTKITVFQKGELVIFIHIIHILCPDSRGSTEENLIFTFPSRATFDEVFKDKRPHLHRLVINPDNTYEISVDNKVLNHGSLMEDFEPSVNPPAEIDDPEDFKPSDWDEREKIPGQCSHCSARASLFLVNPWHLFSFLEVAIGM